MSSIARSCRPFRLQSGGRPGNVSIVGCWVALLAAALGPLSGLAAQEALRIPDAESGARIFGMKGCGQCHAAWAEGKWKAPDLTSLADATTFYGLAADMWNHIPIMRNRMIETGIAQPTLSGNEMADVIAFLFRSSYEEARGDAPAGATVFRDKHCIACHQVAGAGGLAGPDLSHSGQFNSPIDVAAAMWNHGLAMEQAMTARGVERIPLSGSELVDLLAYLRSEGSAEAESRLFPLPGTAGRGRELYESKGCIACHGRRGTGGAGPNLAARGRDWNLMDYAAGMWNKASAMSVQVRALGADAPELTAGEMADIVAYLYSLRFFEASGDAVRGRRRIKDNGCLDCHSLDGSGQGTASEISRVEGLDSPPAVLAALWNHIGAALEPGGDSWPIFEDHEMADLVAFLVARP